MTKMQQWFEIEVDRGATEHVTISKAKSVAQSQALFCQNLYLFLPEKYLLFSILLLLSFCLFSALNVKHNSATSTFLPPKTIFGPPA